MEEPPGPSLRVQIPPLVVRPPPAVRGEAGPGVDPPAPAKCTTAPAGASGGGTTGARRGGGGPSKREETLPLFAPAVPLTTPASSSAPPGPCSTPSADRGSRAPLPLTRPPSSRVGSQRPRRVFLGAAPWRSDCRGRREDDGGGAGRELLPGTRALGSCWSRGASGGRRRRRETQTERGAAAGEGRRGEGRRGREEGAGRARALLVLPWPHPRPSQTPVAQPDTPPMAFLCPAQVNKLAKRGRCSHTLFRASSHLPSTVLTEDLTHAIPESLRKSTSHGIKPGSFDSSLSRFPFPPGPKKTTTNATQKTNKTPVHVFVAFEVDIGRSSVPSTTKGVGTETRTTVYIH